MWMGCRYHHGYSRWPNVKKAAFRQESTKFGMDLYLDHIKLLGRGDTENHVYEQNGGLFFKMAAKKRGFLRISRFR